MAIRLQEVAVGSSFWFRRLSAISLMVSLSLIVLYLVSVASGENIEAELRIPVAVAFCAGFSALVSALAMWLGRDAKSLPWGAASYALLATTALILLITTGGIFSPYIIIWMLAAIFSALFGLAGVGLLALAANVLVVWQIMDPASEVAGERLVLFVLAIDLPLLASYIIWHKKPEPGITQKDEAVSDLAKQLTEVANKSEIVIKSIADGVIAADNKGVVQLYNPAAQYLTGWDSNDAKGLQYESVLRLLDKHDKPLAHELNPFEQVKTIKKTIIDNELTLVTKTEKKMIISLVVSPVLEDKEVVAVIAVFRDITAEKAREREQAEFVSTASHEMRTPVAAIEGYLGLMANPQTAEIDDKARQYLGKAQEAVRHLGRLFQDLLTVSRSEDGRLEDHPQLTDIVAYVASITEGLMLKAKEKGLTLRFDPYATEQGNKVTPIYFSKVDRDHLREVAANLVENAIKYTKEGQVNVDVTGDEKNVTIAVKDTGFGIAPEDIPHLFQKFYRVDNSDTREIGGTGLGLYICHRLTEAMGGGLRVESEVGKGSTFYISLPRISNLEIKHLQQSQAIEELQRNITVTAIPRLTAKQPAAGQAAAGSAVSDIKASGPEKTAPPRQSSEASGPTTQSMPEPSLAATVPKAIDGILPVANNNGLGRGTLSIPNRK